VIVEPKKCISVVLLDLKKMVYDKELGLEINFDMVLSPLDAVTIKAYGKIASVS